MVRRIVGNRFKGDIRNAAALQNLLNHALELEERETAIGTERQYMRLIRQLFRIDCTVVIELRQIDLIKLIQACGLIAVVQVVHQRFQHRRKGSSAHDAELRTQRVENLNRLALDAVRRKGNIVIHLRIAEGEVECFVEAASTGDLTDLFLKDLLRCQCTQNCFAAEQRGRNVVIAVQTGNFFCNITHTGDIGAEVWNNDLAVFHFKTELVQICNLFLCRQINTEQGIDLLRLERKTLVLRAGGIDINDTVDNLAGAQHLNQLTGTIDCIHGHAGIQTLFKAAGCLGTHAELLRGNTDGCAVEVCRLKDNHVGGVRDLGIVTAHDAGNSGRTAAVRDADHVLIQLMHLTVQRFDALTGSRAADDNLLILQAGIVECMHRLAVFQHDIVGDIDNVVDRADTGSMQTLAHPRRRRLDLDILDQTCSITRAEIRSLIGDAQMLVDITTAALDNRRVQLELTVKGRRSLTRQTDDTHAIRTVGRDLKFSNILIQTDNCADVNANRRALRHKQQTFRIAVRRIVQRQAEFLERAHHAVGRNAAQLALGNLNTARKGGLVQGNRNNTADNCVRCTGYNLNRLVLTDIYLADNQMIGVRMGNIGQDFSGNNIFELAAEIDNFLNLGAGHGHFGIVFLIGNAVHIHKFGKPAHRQLHVSFLQIYIIRYSLCLELVQETHIVLIEITDIGDLEPAHDQALQTDAECIARILVRINAADLENLRVNHAAAQNFNPALTVAYRTIRILAVALEALIVHLCGRLGEREVVRTEADNRLLAVQLLRKHFQNALQIGHADAFVDDQTFDLMEQRGMGRIDVIAAEYTARCNDADRRLLVFHRADLNRRGLRAENDVVGYIEGVLRIACRMILRNVQGFEIVVVGLDIRTLCDRESHADKDILDFIQNKIDRMLLADRNFSARHRDIQCLALELALEGNCFQTLLVLSQARFNRRAEVIDHLTKRRTFLRREAAHILHQSRDLALFAEVFDADRIKLTGVSTGSHSLCSHLPNGL